MRCHYTHTFYTALNTSVKENLICSKHQFGETFKKVFSSYYYIYYISITFYCIYIALIPSLFLWSCNRDENKTSASSAYLPSIHKVQCSLHSSNPKNQGKLGRIIPKSDYRAGELTMTHCTEVLPMGDNGVLSLYCLKK